MTLNADVLAFVEKNPKPARRGEAETLIELIGRITGEPARMWGPTIIGFGEYHYKYASGRQGDAPAAAFSPRTPAITIYLPDGVGTYSDELGRLGPHTTGVGCLYVTHLSDVDLSVLEAIIGASYRNVTSGTFPHRARESSERPATDA